MCTAGVGSDDKVDVNAGVAVAGINLIYKRMHLNSNMSLR